MPIARTARTSTAAVTWAAMVGACLLSGCRTAPRRDPAAVQQVNQAALKHDALTCLQRGLQYRPNPAVRIAAVESLRRIEDPQTLPWIRTALIDEHPAVRFAGCVAVGELRDEGARSAVRQRLNDENPSVQAAAAFALHRLGDHTHSGRLTSVLLTADDPVARRNAAVLLGLADEPAAVPVLARAMMDDDEGVRNQALEAMARLGNHDARQELVFMTNAGVGADELFALHALAATNSPEFVETFRYKLQGAQHLETRLAAAYGLARHRMNDGWELALDAALAPRAGRRDPADPPAGQMLRIRQLACRVLGAAKKPEALPTLERIMRESDDPREQISAAGAVLEIVEANRFQLADVPPPRAGRTGSRTGRVGAR